MSLARKKKYNSGYNGSSYSRYESSNAYLPKNRIPDYSDSESKPERKSFSMNEKYNHYKAIAVGDGDVKDSSKFSEAEQRAYARGQVAAREEQARVYKKYGKKK